MNSLFRRIIPASRSMSEKGGFFNKLMSSMFGNRSDPTTTTTISSTMPRHLVGRIDDLKDGQMKEVELSFPTEGDDKKNFKILLSRIQGKYYATSHLCPHYRARLVTGVLSPEGRVTCPWHAACFDVRTGDIEEAPALSPLKTFEILVEEEGKIYVLANKEQLMAPEPKACSHLISEHPFKPDNNQKIIIIGGGGAGGVAAEAARAAGFTGRIILVSKEPHLPIDRIKLSKLLDVQVDNILLYPPFYYQQQLGIECRLGVQATGLDTKLKTVQLSTGESLEYDHLLLATGGIPRKLSVPGGELGNIFTIRHIEDNQQILEFIKQSAVPPQVVIIGASFIGMEAAAMLTKQPVASVTVVGLESVPLANVLGPQVGLVYKRLHEKNRVQFKLGTGIASFEEHSQRVGQVGKVNLSDSSTLEADLVIVGVGVRPATDFATSLSREPDGSFLTDRFLMLQENKDIFIAGDIARFPLLIPNPELNDTISLRVEHWDVALQQGRIAGHNMAISLLGKEEEMRPYTSVPFFFTMQYMKSIRYAGAVPKGWDDIWLEGDIEGDSPNFAAYYLKEDQVLAVATMGRDPLAVHCSELIRQGRMPSASQLKHGLSPLTVPL